MSGQPAQQRPTAWTKPLISNRAVVVLTLLAAIAGAGWYYTGTATVYLENQSEGQSLFYVDGVQACDAAPSTQCLLRLYTWKSHTLSAVTSYGGNDYATPRVDLQPERSAEYSYISCGTMGVPGQNCGLFTGKAAPQPRDDPTVVPGVRIGKWTLQMTIHDLERMNGEPIQELRMAGHENFISASADFTEYQWAPRGIGAATRDGKRVESLIAGIKGMYVPYKTEKGLGLLGTSTREEVLTAYGKPTAEVKMGGAFMTAIYDKIGIAFDIENSGEISKIWIFRPGSGKRIWKW